jgi:hypothetical protein
MSVCDRGDIPKGYKVRYHELRGYDSPDKWFSAVTVRGRMIGEFGSYRDAVAACKKDQKDKLVIRESSR